MLFKALPFSLDQSDANPSVCFSLAVWVCGDWIFDIPGFLLRRKSKALFQGHCGECVIPRELFLSKEENYFRKLMRQTGRIKLAHTI